MLITSRYQLYFQSKQVSVLTLDAAGSVCFHCEAGQEHIHGKTRTKVFEHVWLDLLDSLLKVGFQKVQMCCVGLGGAQVQSFSNVPKLY